MKYHTIGVNTIENTAAFHTGCDNLALELTCDQERGAGMYLVDDDCLPLRCNPRKALPVHFQLAGYRTIDFRELGVGDFRNCNEVAYPQNVICMQYDQAVSYDSQATVLQHLVHLEEYIAQHRAGGSDVPLFSTSHMYEYSHNQENPAWLVLDKRLSKLLDPVGGVFDTFSDFILLAGDHGWNSGPFASTLPGILDRKLPLFAMLAPRRFLSSSQIDALAFNQQSLVTIHDIALTVRLLPWLREDGEDILAEEGAYIGYRWLSPQQTQYGRSLLSRIGHDRQCHNAGIPASECITSVVASQAGRNEEACLGMELLAVIQRQVLETLGDQHCATFSGREGWTVSSFNILSGRGSQVRAAARYVVVTLKHEVTTSRKGFLSFGGVYELESGRMKFGPSSIRRLSRYAHELCHDAIPPHSARPLCACKSTFSQLEDAGPRSLAVLCSRSTPVTAT